MTSDLRTRLVRPGSSTSDGDAGRANVWDALRTLVKHRWWALGGFLLLAVPTAAITLSTTPVYRATTRLLLAEEPPPGVALGTTAGPERRAAAIDPTTRSEVVRSRAVARDVVTALKLWEAPEYADIGQDAASDVERAQRLVDPFLSHLSVQVVPLSQVMAVSFESTDPMLAARAANRVAAKYLERERESRFEAAAANSTWLSTRLAEQRQAVESAETALQVYRRRRDALSLSDRQNIVGQKLADLNASVTKAKTDRILRETQFQQVQALEEDPAALDSQPLIAGNTVVQGLKAQMTQLARQDAELANRLGPKHPDRTQVASALESVTERLQAEVTKVVSGIEAEYQAALTLETSLTSALDLQKTEAFSLDQKGVEYSALEREAVSARQVFDALLQQTKQASLSGGVEVSGMRVVDQAEPPGAPVRPRRGQGLAVAGLLGLLGAAGCARGREYMRRTVQSPKDIEERLGLPVLAIVPQVAGADAEAIETLGPLAGEAFRRLRSAVMLDADAGAAAGKVVVVTSAAPGDGKTFVSSHLAIALASVAQRVVLIDADMRRPRLHTMFTLDRAPGLADVLLHQRSISEVLRPVGPEGLVLLPSGQPYEKAAELLSMPAYKAFVDALRQEFDWIIIDSPPVMPVSDATVLARDAAAVLFVASADRTSLEAAEAALTDLDAAGARMLGAVLNRAPLTRESFYYSRYYRRDYGAYLDPGASAETPRAEGAPGPS